MGLFLTWNRHYSGLEKDAKEALFETYYFRAHYAFCVGRLTKTGKTGDLQIRYAPDLDFVSKLPSLSYEIKINLGQIQTEFENVQETTWEKVCDFIEQTILNKAKKISKPSVANLFTKTTLLILLTVPTHPHKGSLLWQIAVMGL